MPGLARATSPGGVPEDGVATGLLDQGRAGQSPAVLDGRTARSNGSAHVVVVSGNEATGNEATGNGATGNGAGALDRPTLLRRLAGAGHWVLAGHWLGRWYSERAVKFWRYSAGSIIAWLVSEAAVFACSVWLDLGAGTAAVVGFIAGAIPNWVLNRRWAWQRRDRHGITKETVLYVVVTGASFALTVGATKLAAIVMQHVHTSEVTRGAVLALSYGFATAVLWVLKYVAYDRLVFTGRRTSRSQVLSTTAPKRNP
jgi:putative flippase GtrA